LRSDGDEKLTAAERLVDDQMLAMLEWASYRPGKWHKIGNLVATKKAAELLAKCGAIEIWEQASMCRLKQTTKSWGGRRVPYGFWTGCPLGGSSINPHDARLARIFVVARL
jgi:hypothetical protein